MLANALICPARSHVFALRVGVVQRVQKISMIAWANARMVPLVSIWWMIIIVHVQLALQVCMFSFDMHFFECVNFVVAPGLCAVQI